MRAVEDRHGIDFETYFAPDLARLGELAADRLVEVDQGLIRATSRGRLLLRIICACFDRYLQQPARVPARYSRAV